MSAAAIVSSVGWTLMHFVWQGALIGCATAVALIAMRNARAEHRYAVACAALLLCLAWPAHDLAVRLAGAGADTGIPLIALGLALGSGTGAPAGALSMLQQSCTWIVGCWAVCVVALGIRMALGLLWIQRAANSKHTNAHWQERVEQLARDFGVDRAVRLRIVDTLSSPVTAGWWRPVVLVPASLVSGMPAHLLEALLAHEMAHIRRFDYLVNLGQNVIEALLFYHPAVWWISGRIRIEREQIADDLAARQLGEPRRLALALSELERFQFSTQHLAQAANGGELMTRIQRLLRPDTQALNWKAAIPVIGLAGALLAGCAQQPTVAVVRTAAVVNFQTCAKPVYPADALRDRKTGGVSLNFLVSEDGAVRESRVLASSGTVSLDDAAREAIGKCTFKPATAGGKPVQEWVKVKYVWALE